MSRAAIDHTRMLVSRGQVYASRPDRHGARERFIAIVGLSRGQQPRATWREVTRTGRLKNRKSGAPVTTFLTCVDGSWQMPSRYRLVP